ncbi:TonB-dependent receptor [Sphingomonas bacterium]|uniref:TonB-dependent receptor n=1 Tax=Sphingomonas bacterium TaxID=1895847 RepID=UPI00262BFEA6|nr:TonB-dependent receptor [Sphingomonas bacterium]
MAQSQPVPEAAPSAAPVDPAVSTVEPVQDTPSSSIEDIVVTATRRAERLQDVPIAVTAIGGSQLASAGVTDIRQLTAVVPGFNGGRNFAVMQPVIRGVGSTGITLLDESNVAVYIDGIYQPNSYTTMLELVEVERVEVLRGPQGTIFGRNATGGLVNVITPDPKHDFRGKVVGSYARFGGANDVNLRGYVTGGLSDTVAMDLAVVYRHNGGYIDDLVNGGQIGRTSYFDVRSKLLFEPSDNVEIVLTLGYANSEDFAANAVQPYENNARGRAFPGNILASRPYQASLNLEPFMKFDRYNAALKVSTDIGFANLESTTAYTRSSIDQQSDSDASNILLAQNEIHPQSEAYSQEFRLLSGGGGPFRWIAGLYAFRQTGEALVNVITSAGPPAPVNRTVINASGSTTAFAGFAEGTYALTDRLELTVGARYSDEKRDMTAGANGRIFVDDVDTSFSQLTYRGSLKYDLSPTANVYASYSTGFKSGVFNTYSVSPVPTDPERIKALEVGFKADPLSWLRTNAAIFKYVYDDLQVTARDQNGTAYILQNAAKADIWGGELEVTAMPTPDLSIRVAASYNKATYDEFPLAQVYVPLPAGGNQTAALDVSGNDLIRAPRYTLNLGVGYGFDLGGGRVQLSGNLFHSAKVFHDFLNIAVQDAYSLLNAEIAWTDAAQRVRVALFGSNLTDARVAQQITPGPVGTYLSYEKPLRVGASVQLNF